MESKSITKHKFHIKTGDTVKVISGDSKGKSGKVTKILTKEDKAIVEGLNIVTRHVKPTATKPNGGIVKKEAPIHISNLMVVDASGKATRIGRKEDKEGKLVRYSKKSNEIIK